MIYNAHNMYVYNIQSRTLGISTFLLKIDRDLQEFVQISIKTENELI